MLYRTGMFITSLSGAPQDTPGHPRTIQGYPGHICEVILYVLVITPLRGMLLVYRPDARGRVAPEGEGL